MIKGKDLLLTIGILVAVVPTVIRFVSSGWLLIFGMISVIVFSVLHISLLVDINKYYDKLYNSDRLSAWIAVIIYPLIFLFQFDSGNQIGNIYMFEFITGYFRSSFEMYGFLIAIAAGLTYAMIFVRWRFLKSTYRSQQHL